MITFLPYANFTQSAQTLDRQRLGKQRIEALQIFKTLLQREDIPPPKWINHPACLMWAGYEYDLCRYGYEICKEWKRRKYIDNLQQKFQVAKEIMHRLLYLSDLPQWSENEELHRSHRLMLWKKDPYYYNQFAEEALSFPLDQEIKYVWPITKGDTIPPLFNKEVARCILESI